ncbi:MAG TPA: HAMP domain-containing sensor histidine kinase [Steroidobacteraceae bacterium]|nr:HAMP domain-containing sensor histidine kinase [Steroidobacteraceae bacterium]
MRCVALAGLLLFGPAWGEAQPPIRQVLLLQSFDRGNMILDRFTGDLRIDLDQLAGRPLNVVQVVVGPTGFVGAPELAVVDFIRSTYADRPKPDLIVTVAGPAAVFARKYRRQLFPDSPLLFTAVDQRYLGTAPLGENETAVAVVNDFPGLVDDILQLLPQTKQVFMVMGSGQIGRFWHQELNQQFMRFRDRLTFIWSDELTLPEILRRCASLPEHSAIFYITFGTDAAGAAYADERVLAELHSAANAPLFSRHGVFLGSGVVGGRMMSIDDLGRSAADAALRLLNGASPSSVSVPPQPPGQPIFDWRELKRWGIPESRLPSGSVVRYRSPSVWREYRGTILIMAGALAIQALLIIGLLFERRARHRAEIDSRRSLALAADAGRRETMSALTHSILHELIQPLSSMMHNTQALEMMIAAKHATPDTIGEVLSDIQSEGLRATQIIERYRTMLRSRRLQEKPIDLHTVVKECLALVAPDLAARQIAVNLNLCSNPCVISGDQVLLQQVFLNLVINAMDAMAEMPPSLRQVTITSQVVAAEAAVSVSDMGPGLPADIIGTVFTPFVTTKSHGLGIGLTIARSIVAAHGGTIKARNNPEGGATFTVTLRVTRSGASDDAAAVPARDRAHSPTPTMEG